MLLLSVIVLSLLSTALAFSLVELGLVAYAVHYYDQSETISYYCGYLEECDETIHGTVPDIVAFLMFCAVWSVLITAIAIWLPFHYHKRDGHHHNSWLAPGLIVVYFVTWVFWLAGFADLAYLYGSNARDIPAAILAFAVLNWLVYMALFIFSFLAIFDVLRGEWPGYLVMQSRSSGAEAPATSSAPAFTGAPAEPKYEANHELTA